MILNWISEKYYIEQLEQLTLREGLFMNSQEILELYCDNEMAELKKICYPILTKIGGISNKDYDDFYSIALDALADSVLRFDDTKKCKFKTFLFGNIQRKFKTEIRDRNREKRIPSKKIESMSNLITEDGMELEETIPSEFNTYEEACCDDFEGTNIQIYMERLSLLQREIVKMLSLGYKGKEIRENLHISQIAYKENLAAIQSYENIRILKRNTYKKQM